jgi:phage tail protein X
MANTTVTTYDGERWDQLAFRAYGDATLMNLIIDANPTVSIDDRLTGGMVLVVPIVGNTTVKESTQGLPPWKQ